VKKSQPMPIIGLASMSVYMTGGKSGTTKLVFTYMWPSCEQKVPNWGKFAPNLGRFAIPIVREPGFPHTHAKSNKNQYTLCPTPPEQTNSIPQYPRYFWMCLLNLTKDCPSNHNQHPLSKMGKISKS
jgi:hypothetical protein